MCRAFRPDGYDDACEEFLSLHASKLDDGYSAPLQKEALAKGSYAASLAYLTSDSIQSELEGLFRNASASSLEVERKHQQDKRSEKQRISSMARFSRNSILQRYLIGRKRRTRWMLKEKKQISKDKFMSSRSLAVKRNPHLLSRPMGKRFGMEASSSQWAYKAAEGQLEKYLQEHRESLEQEAADIRNHARQREKLLHSDVPHTNADWLAWLETNEEMFKDTLKNATSARRPLSQRLVPLPGGLPEAPRLQPIHEKVPNPPWIDKLRQLGDSGFCCLQSSEHIEQKHVFFVSFCKGVPWAVLLHPVPAGSYQAAHKDEADVVKVFSLDISMPIDTLVTHLVKICNQLKLFDPID
eukprot:6396182-Karenia_brevis.AAC.1